MGNFMSTEFANDIIVVRQPDGTLWSSPVRFPDEKDVADWNKKIVTVSINGKTLKTKFSLNKLKDHRGSGFASSFLKKLQLHHDRNDIRLHGEGVQVNTRMFLWCRDSRIVVVDVDGTITKSDVRGMILNSFGIEWAHDGVCHLFSAIYRNGYKVIYLSGRPRQLGNSTRKLLEGIVQDGEGLPEGAVFVSPDGLIAAVRRYVSDRQGVDFKIPMLEQIGELFPSGKGAKPYYAGFGNEYSDDETYSKLEILCKRRFQLNPSKGGIDVKCDMKTVAFFPNGYYDVSKFLNEFFPQVQTVQHLNTLRLLLRGPKTLFRNRSCGNH